MPVRFLNDAQRERFNRFPETIPQPDLITYFALSEEDLEQVQRQRGDDNRLGFALQLTGLRYLGFCPDHLTTTPPEVVNYLAEQLDVSPAALKTYGKRAHTRTDHLKAIQLYLGWRDATSENLSVLEQWLLERALEHNKPTLLLQLASEFLYQNKIVRPGITRLERMVATVREQAQLQTFCRLKPLFTPSRQNFLDQLLVRDDQLGCTFLTWLRQGATANSPAAIQQAIAKLQFLKKVEVDTWEMGKLHPNRLKFLAQLGKKSTPQALQRSTPERRYSILAAFSYQLFEEITDEVVDLYNRCLANAYARSRRDLEEFRRSTAKSTNEKLRLFEQLAGVIRLICWDCNSRLGFEIWASSASIV